MKWNRRGYYGIDTEATYSYVPVNGYLGSCKDIDKLDGRIVGSVWIIAYVMDLNKPFSVIISLSVRVCIRNLSIRFNSKNV